MVVGTKPDSEQAVQTMLHQKKDTAKLTKAKEGCFKIR
jgi:hypothetical protein